MKYYIILWITIIGLTIYLIRDVTADTYIHNVTRPIVIDLEMKIDGQPVSFGECTNTGKCQPVPAGYVLSIKPGHEQAKIRKAGKPLCK